MRLRPLVALIMKSQTYQLDASPNATNADDEANFARAAVRLLPAEVLLDAIGQVARRARPVPTAPRRLRRRPVPGAPAENGFLKVFGKPERLLTCECERSETTTLAQAFQLINGPSVRRKLEATDNRIGRLLDAARRRPRRSSTSCTSPRSAASRRPPERGGDPGSRRSVRRPDPQEPGRTWPGRSSTARNSCCGIER